MSPLEEPYRQPRRRSPLRRASLTAAAAVVLSACVTREPPPPPPIPAPIVIAPIVHCDPPRDPQDMAARHVLATQERLSALNTADLAQEASHPIDPDSIEAAMDQALALSMTRNPGDLARAQGVLDQVLHNNTSQADPFRGLARLLAYRLGEQRRAEELAERNAQALRDAQRDSQRKLDQLNDKLEALKAIERSLNTRPAQKPNP